MYYHDDRKSSRLWLILALCCMGQFPFKGHNIMKQGLSCVNWSTFGCGVHCYGVSAEEMKEEVPRKPKITFLGPEPDENIEIKSCKIHALRRTITTYLEKYPDHVDVSLPLFDPEEQLNNWNQSLKRDMEELRSGTPTYILSFPQGDGKPPVMSNLGSNTITVEFCEIEADEDAANEEEIESLINTEESEGAEMMTNGEQ